MNIIFTLYYLSHNEYERNFVNEVRSKFSNVIICDCSNMKSKRGFVFTQKGDIKQKPRHYVKSFPIFLVEDESFNEIRRLEDNECNIENIENYMNKFSVIK